jgi:hypothetical protein
LGQDDFLAVTNTIFDLKGSDILDEVRWFFMKRQNKVKLMQIKFFEKVFCSAKYNLDFDIWILLLQTVSIFWQKEFAWSKLHRW